MSDKAGMFKIHFRLTPDEDGYPPVAVESLWATKDSTEEGFAIDNVPFFTRDATLGDVVEGSTDDEGNRWFIRTISRSANSLIRVTFFDKSSVNFVSASLETMGCSTEYEKPHNLLAVSVPGSVSLGAVQHYLQSEASIGRIDYEEAILRQ